MYDGNVNDGSSSSNSMFQTGQRFLMEQIAGGAGERVKLEVDKLRSWLTSTDRNLNLFCFLGGAATSFISLLGLIGSLLSPFTMLVNLYCFCFGLIIMMLELRPHLGYLVQIPLRYIDEYCKFLTFAMGRGVFYSFVGSLMFVHGGLIRMLVGCYMCVIGALLVIVSFRTQTQIDEMQEQIEEKESLELELTSINPRKSPEFIRQQFDLYDSDKDGFITSKELQALSKSLGTTLDSEALRQALQILDCDKTGKIDRQEFMVWFSGQDISFV